MVPVNRNAAWGTAEELTHRSLTYADAVTDRQSEFFDLMRALYDDTVSAEAFSEACRRLCGALIVLKEERLLLKRERSGGHEHDT